MLLAIILLFLLLLIIFSIPAVQTAVGKKATNWLNEKYNTNINIERIGLKWNGDISMKDIYIEDYLKDTLIHINALETSILSFNNVLNNKLEFGTVNIEGLTLNINTEKDSTDTTLDVFIAKLDSEPSDGTPSNFLLTSSKLKLNDSKFRYKDQNNSTPDMLDFKELSGTVYDFKVQGPNVSGDVQNLTFLDVHGLRVNEMNTIFHYSLTQMRFDNLLIKTDNSQLNGSVVFDYERKDFANFLDKVKLSAKFTDSKIDFNELNYFYDEFGNKKGTFSTEIVGVLNDFTTKNFDFKSPSTIIKGDVQYKNLFNSSRMFYMKGDFERFSSNNYQLTTLLPNILGVNLPKTLNRLGQFSMTGTTEITENVINADVRINTEIGNSVLDINIVDVGDRENALYEGEIQFENFNLGVYLNDPMLGTISSDVFVDGKGFTEESLNTEVVGTVSSIYYNDYMYKNLNVSGVLKDQLFDGSLVSRDPNADFNFEGLANFAGAENEFRFKASINTLDLNKLNFVQRDDISLLKGDMVLDLVGNTIDDMAGDIFFKKISYTNQNSTYTFKNFSVHSEFSEEDIRKLTIDSPDIIKGTVTGRFHFDEVLDLVQNSVGSIYTNYRPIEVLPNQYLNFNFKIYNKIVDVFLPDVELSKNTSLRGSIRGDQNEFKLTFKTPQIIAYGSTIDNVEMVIDNKNPVFNTYIEVANVTTEWYDAKEFSLINTTLKDTLFFKTEFKGGKGFDDNYNLSFYHTIDSSNKSVVGLKKSDVSFRGNKWFINEKNDRKNRFIFDKNLDSIFIEKIVMNHENEEIDLEGELFGKNNKSIKLEFINVGLEKITPSIDSIRLGGKVNGKLDIKQINGGYIPKSKLGIASLEVNDKLLGDLNIDITGDENLERFGVNAKLVNETLESLTAFGSINVANNVNTIDVDAKIDKFDISPFSALGEDVITEIRGLISGEAKVVGNLSNPAINGELSMLAGGLYIPYLNVDVDLANSSIIKLYDQTFEFDDVTILDTQDYTKGQLNGTIKHTAFDNWELGLKLSTDRLLVLNTEYNEEEEEENLYYGTGYISGEAWIDGPTDQLTIKVEGRTEKGTDLKIPISYVASVGDASFIKFVTKEEFYDPKSQEETALDDFKGLELEFDLDVTPDAVVEIEVDRKAGSSIKGSGFGSLLMQINTNGKFNMFGDFITDTGEYNFKYRGIINKKFTLKPAGTIRWEGDPFKAQLNVEAVYGLQANPDVLLDAPTYNKKIPVEVGIRLTGDLMKPDPIFNITFPSTQGGANSELMDFLLNDDDKRRLQALSLLSQGRFVNDVNINQNVLTGNLIETATGIFNDALSDDDDIVKVGVNYSQADRSLNLDTADLLGLTVSSQISDKITFNGQIGVPVGGVTQTAIVGDAEIEISLNEDRSLTAKIFNRQNQIQYVGEIEGFTQGVGLSYHVDFDTLKELVDKVFKGKKKMAEEKLRKELEEKLQKELEEKNQVGGGVVTYSTKKELEKEAKKESKKEAAKKEKETPKKTTEKSKKANNKKGE
ncbi:translocation/assembly module TamB domain-containing protein [uncultured Kordia sp.]|uniref:translocation/assembly module TamB domain-containing protein n=1 Tax=uncultured Kordia sp. TaxID=507699 RepID=UPI00260F7C52|nr:translocation/assembly module TamB domain-containing protein [uncultured Kordia sp.]